MVRYGAGEHASVWDEIRRLGEVDAERRDEVSEVSRLTMRRARPQIERIVEGFMHEGLEAASSELPIRLPPPVDVSARLGRIELVHGPLPAAFTACLSEIGSVWLCGDVPTLGLTYETTVARSMPPGGGYPDPLSLPTIDYLEWSFEEWDSDSPDEQPTPMEFEFAPDELHKAGVSGGTHDIELPSRVADPVISGVAGRPKITLVEYLRASVAWGGLPGYEFDQVAPPIAVQNLRAIPNF